MLIWTDRSWINVEIGVQSFNMEIFKPQAVSIIPIGADVSFFPKEEKTPPVMKMYFLPINLSIEPFY